MPIPSIYINLEDDVSRIAQRIKKEKAKTLVLVCPKRCFLFNDSINLRLLKKQTDLLGKEVFILTMDERGQSYAEEAGFQLKFLPKTGQSRNFSDVVVKKQAGQAAAASPKHEEPVKAAVKAKSSSKASDRPVVTAEEFVEEFRTKKTHSSLRSSPVISFAESFFPKEIEEEHKIKAKKRNNQKFITAFVAVSLVIILAVVFVVLPKATVAVYPKTEPITRDLEISLTSAAKEPDAGKLILPAAKVSETLDIQDKFQSQGKKEVGNKASGMVKIYNFTKQPLNLKAGTTILTVSSKNYRLESDITGLKPTLYKDAKTKEVDESSLGEAVKVVAEQGGEGYNLPAGVRMEITNQVFGSKPQFLFAKTDTAITGGTSRFLSFVSDQDVANSKNALVEQAVSKVQDRLKTQSLVMPEKSYVFEVLQFSTDKPVGTESPNFSSSVKVKITGLSFNVNDLKNLIYNRIGQSLSSSKDLTVSNDSQLNFKIKTIDLNNELAVLSAHFEGQAVYNIYLDNIASTLTGKSQAQVNEILKSNSQIEKIEITLAPSWQKNFPWFAQKIDVKLGKSK